MGDTITDNPVETPIDLFSFGNKFNALAHQMQVYGEADRRNEDDEKRYNAYKQYGVDLEAKTDTYWKIRYLYYKDVCDFNSNDALADPDPRISNLARKYAIAHLDWQTWPDRSATHH